MRNNLIAICALAILPAVAVGQGVGAQARAGSDTGQTTQRQGQVRQGEDTVTSSASGSIAAHSGLGLRTDQVRLLQQALNATGCNTGAVDGVVGPKTRTAIHCAEQQRNYSGGDINKLLKAFGFHFTADNTNGANAAADTSALRMRDTTRRP